MSISHKDLSCKNTTRPFGAVIQPQLQEDTHDMARIILFGAATLQSRRRETARKGGRPCSRFFSLLIVALLALPSFAHETEHHRVTADILEEIQDLRDDIDDLLDENGNTENGNTENGNTENGNTENGNGNTGYYYGALSQALLGSCREVVWYWYYDTTSSRQSIKDAAVSGCVSEGGDRSDCTSYTTEFGSAWGNGETYRCIALAAAGSLVSGYRPLRNPDKLGHVRCLGEKWGYNSVPQCRILCM